MGFESTFYVNMKRFVSLARPPRQPLSSRPCCLLQRCLQSFFFFFAITVSFLFFLYIFLAALGSFFGWGCQVIGGPRLVSSNDKEESRQQVGEYEDLKGERKTRIAVACSDRV